MIIDQLTPTVSDNLTDEVPVEQGTATFKTTWQKILNLFKGNITASDIASTDGDVQDDIDDLQTGKQDTLVSGTNIKTIGNSSLLGSGDIAFPVTSVNGDTGAVVLDADDVGAMSKWVLLWTNASPTSAFAAQTVALDLSNYSQVMIVVKIANDDDSGGNFFGFVGKSILMTLFPMTLTAQYKRLANIQSNGVVFGSGYFNTGVNDVVIVPYQIYGIKGIS